MALLDVTIFTDFYFAKTIQICHMARASPVHCPLQITLQMFDGTVHYSLDLHWQRPQFQLKKNGPTLSMMLLFPRRASHCKQKVLKGFILGSLTMSQKPGILNGGVLTFAVERMSNWKSLHALTWLISWWMHFSAAYSRSLTCVLCRSQHNPRANRPSQPATRTRLPEKGRGSLHSFRQMD